MRARALTPDDFRQFVGRTLQRFFEDWTAHRSMDPEAFDHAMSTEHWWESFSEFAMSEMVNSSRMTAAPAVSGSQDT